MILVLYPPQYHWYHHRTIFQSSHWSLLSKGVPLDCFGSSVFMKTPNFRRFPSSMQSLVAWFIILCNFVRSIIEAFPTGGSSSLIDGATPVLLTEVVEAQSSPGVCYSRVIFWQGDITSNVPSLNSKRHLSCFEIPWTPQHMIFWKKRTIVHFDQNQGGDLLWLHPKSLVWGPQDTIWGHHMNIWYHKTFDKWWTH